MLALLLTFALQEPVGPFDPVRHESLDRTWAIEIDPLESRGAGAADYRFLHAGELVWSGRLPFALDQLRVTDDGFVVGCASTLGRGAWEGELLIVRITPAGVARVCAVAPKKGPDAPHGPSSPLVVAVKTFAEPAHFRVELDGLRKDRLTSIWYFALPDGDPITSAPREKSPWFEREWTADPIEEPPPVVPIAALEVSALPVLHAEPLGEFRLATTVPPDKAFVAVGRDGTIAVLDGRSGALALHDASGSLRCNTTVSMENLRPDALDATDRKSVV